MLKIRLRAFSAFQIFSIFDNLACSKWLVLSKKTTLINYIEDKETNMYMVVRISNVLFRKDVESICTLDEMVCMNMVVKRG